MPGARKGRDPALLGLRAHAAARAAVRAGAPRLRRRSAAPPAPPLPCAPRPSHPSPPQPAQLEDGRSLCLECCSTAVVDSKARRPTASALPSAAHFLKAHTPESHLLPPTPRFPLRRRRTPSRSSTRSSPFTPRRACPSRRGRRCTSSSRPPSTPPQARPRPAPAGRGPPPASAQHPPRHVHRASRGAEASARPPSVPFAAQRRPGAASPAGLSGGSPSRRRRSSGRRAAARLSVLPRRLPTNPLHQPP